MMHKRIFFIFSSASIFLFFFVLTSYTPQTSAAETNVAMLVATHDTSIWSPPSPDPAGITYNSITNTLLITDSEVEEMPIYQGKNVFEIALTGELVSSADTTVFSNEPTDIAINSENGHYFLSDDNQKRVYEVSLGLDGVFGTSDDSISSFSTSAFNSSDPEGIAYHQGKLYIADGVGREVYIVDPGVNGVFDGIAPGGDDQVGNFDVEVFGIVDPEGIGYNPDNDTLFVLDSKRTNKIIVEVTTQGELVRSIDISAAGSRKPAGITYAPASNNPGKKSLYIVDRGVDNNTDPNENDGKLYEMSLSSLTPTDTPIPTPTDDPTIPTPTPTSTPTPTMSLLFNPTDDASIYENMPDTNYGSRSAIEIDGGPVKHFLMKFTVTGIGSQPVIRAVLKLYSVNGSTLGGDFYRTADMNWNENGITWNTAPPVEGTVIASLGKVIKNNWYEIDLTPYVTGDGTYSLRISSSSSNGADYTSKEGNGNFIPQLEITL